MEIIPMTLKQANEFVDRFHRHNKHVTGHKFSLGLTHNGELIGVAIVGRPIARNLDNGFNLEVLRVCIKDNAPKGANSKLYARCRAIGQMMGYKKIITYTLKSESQSTMKALGAIQECDVKAHEWTRPSRERSSQPVYRQDKIRWELNTIEV